MPGSFALTFDDGPDPVWTPRLLDALDDAGARATFFPICSRAAAHPQLLHEVRARGHSVGLHGWAHLRHSRSSRHKVAADTRQALAILDPRPLWWRIPWGDPARWSESMARRFGLRVAGWTHDTDDWRARSAAHMLRVLPPLQDGAIVLCHDGVGPGAQREGCAETVALVVPLVAAARAGGLEPVTLDELAKVPTGLPRRRLRAPRAAAAPLPR
jgi:peptidoglycan/xylan/chitin deacetylase (PgdA/CDA1 family)